MSVIIAFIAIIFFLRAVASRVVIGLRFGFIGYLVRRLRFNYYILSIMGLFKAPNPL